MKKKKEYIFNFHYNKIRSRELRRKETKAEMILWKRLRNRQIEGWQYIIIYFKNEEIYNNLENVIDIIKETVNKIETTPLLAERVGEGQG